MTHATRRLPIGIASLAAVALAAAACGPAASSATTSIAASQPAPSFAATAPATAAPSATVVPTATPTASAAVVTCDLKPQTGALPSDRLTGVQVLGLPGRDTVTFHFGKGSLTPAGPPVGSLEVAKPPYTQAGSGATIEVIGDNVLQVTFRGMSLQNDVGQETYTGPTEIKPDLPALRHAVMYDATEGVVGWYVGYDGGGCATLSQTNDDVILTIQHP
jgi:hypothetical protein